MNKLESILDIYPEHGILIADGFDDAILGVVDDMLQIRIAYSRTKCIEILISRDKMSKDDADEYFDFNVGNAYVGEKTPIWVDDTF